MPTSRRSRLRRHPSTLAAVAILAGGVLGTGLLGCGGDPLVVVGAVDVAVSPEVTLVVDFPTATTLVRSPVAINANVAGVCTVTRDGFDVLIARDAAATGLQSLSVSSDGASVQIGDVTYTALEADAGCFIATRAIDPGYGSVTFDIDCVLDDGAGASVTAIGALTFEGCR